MPKKNIDYSKTIIYKIVCRDPTVKDMYVGCTTNFIKRKCNHKFNCVNDTASNYHLYVYSFIRNNGGWDNWDMIEIEKYDCKDQNEQAKRERHYIETLGATLNKVIPSRSQKEYRNINSEDIKEYMIGYHLKNKVKLNQERQRKYNNIKNDENFKEKEKKRKKKYYEANKQDINDKKKKLFLCECGSEIRKNEKNRHIKSKKHQEYLKNI